MTLILDVVVVNYVKWKESQSSSPLSRSSTPRTKSRSLDDHEPVADVRYQLVQSEHLYVKQSSLPVEVERDNNTKSSGVHRQLSEDHAHRSKPKLQPRVPNDHYPDSDSSSVCSSVRDVSSRSKQRPTAASLMIALEASML